MAMKRFRNVAVRIRPIANSETAKLEAEQVAAPSTVPPLPRRVVSASAKVSSKPQIWDLEADEAGEDPSARINDPVKLSSAPVSDTEAQRRVSDGALPSDTSALPLVAAPNSGRSKTRILGFHASDLKTDVFDDPKPIASGPQFPAGFLVVIDGPGRGAFFAVTASVRSIGRGSDQNIALDFGDESISREGHASVMYDEESSRFFVGHGNKANVVRRNGAPILTTEEMTHGDLIRLGKTTLRFHAFCGDDFDWSDTDSGNRSSAASPEGGRDE